MARLDSRLKFSGGQSCPFFLPYSVAFGIKLLFTEIFLKLLNLTDLVGVLANNLINCFHENATKSEKLTSTHL